MFRWVCFVLFDEVGKFFYDVFLVIGRLIV